MQSLPASDQPSRRDDQPWIIISYSLPTEPSRKRVLVWRHLRKLGALYRETGIWFLPRTDTTLEAVKPIVAEIQEMEGKVHAFAATDIDETQADELRQAFNAARREEYTDLLAKCRRFLGHVDRLAQAGDLRFANVEELEEDLEKRRRTLAQLIARDVFGVEERYEAEAAIKDCEEALAGFIEQASLAGYKPRMTFLSAEWRNLVMLNYEIDAAILQPLVPKATELDAWEGKTFVSLVGFRFLHTRVWGLPIPFHRNFEEINLRFYVRHQARNEWRRGVVFVKEIVPRPAIALTARYLYNENYVALPTSHTIQPAGASFEAIESLKYAWRFRGAESSISVTTGGSPIDVLDGSQEDFIAQHYWGYAPQRDGGTMEYHVEHPPWRRIWQCQSGRFHGDAARLYGSQFAEALSMQPSSAFLADGSAVRVHKGIRIA